MRNQCCDAEILAHVRANTDPFCQKVSAAVRKQVDANELPPTVRVTLEEAVCEGRVFPTEEVDMMFDTDTRATPKLELTERALSHIRALAQMHVAVHGCSTAAKRRKLADRVRTGYRFTRPNYSTGSLYVCYTTSS